MRKKTEAKIKDYLETFSFQDIPFQLYPMYSISESGVLFNFKSVVYPSDRSVKRFTRKKQLAFRSLQAKIFDAFINVGFFNPLLVVRDYPVVVQNHLRLENQTGAYYLCDYFFPTLKDDQGHWGLVVELDSELHDEEADSIRDAYLERIGLLVFRIKHLERPDVQKNRFCELTKTMREMEDCGKPRVFSFLDNIHLAKGI